MATKEDAMYAACLTALSRALRVNAEEASRRGLHGLAERLADAEESAASWADALTEDVAA